MKSTTTQPSGYTEAEETEAERLAIQSGLGVSEWPTFLADARQRLAAPATLPVSPNKRQPGNFKFYEQREGKWFCKTCQGVIAAVNRHVSVWDGPGPCAGSGEVDTFQLPYCPNCEERPT